jgi:glycosyltransferase involved in cell wall biosynthesis
MPPRVTIITVTYNKGPRLARTIESILAQTHLDYHYIVIDDGSTDATRALLSRFHDPRLEIRHLANQGFTAAIRAGLENVSTPCIAIQGAGDIAHPARLERQLAYLDAHPEAVAVGCGREDRDESGRVVKSAAHPLRRLTSLAEAIDKNILNHGEVLFRTSAYRLGGGYRVFFKYAQDRDLWLRMIKHGEIVSLPDLLYTRVIDPRADVSGNPAKIRDQTIFSHYAARLAQGDAEGRWDNASLDPAEHFPAFRESLGHRAKRAVARRVYDELRLTRLPPADEAARLSAAARIIDELAPRSWMTRELALRRLMLRGSPALFSAYANTIAAWLRRRAARRSRRGA